jgi:outer membrane lipoprotein SlyB
MKHHRNLNLIATATIILALTNCTNIKDDGTRTRTEGALGGAVAGGILGAVIGNQTGAGSERGALIGATLGGLGGLAYGDHVAKQKAANISKEEWFDQCIASATKTNNRAYAYNQSLRRKISGLSSRIAAARASKNNSELRALRSEVAGLQKENQGQMKAVNTEISEQSNPISQAGSSSQGRSLRTAVTKLKSTESSLRGNDQKLASMQSSIDV